MNVRVRYAPSPTGLQHIGGIRTVVFNYLLARATGGKFILRIEDTDQNRYFEGAEEDVYNTLQWLGISIDEGPRNGGPFAPYKQSERIEMYQKYAKQLVDEGKAYYCYCDVDRLERIRKIQETNKMPPGYDRRCRHISHEEVEEAKKQGITPVIRFKIPLEGETSFNDVILGKITRENKDITPDPVILKSDGFPTYHLANIIDDHHMEITHILRAQEWVPSGPLHVLIYEAFGWTPPIYCHLPMVMGNDGLKLSKRHGDTHVLKFRENGYLPEAIFNYITLLGWSYDDKTEFFTKEELEKIFDYTRISKSPSVFDYKKLTWFNGHYIRRKTTQELYDLTAPILLRDGIIGNTDEKTKAKLMEILPLVQERLEVLNDVSEASRFFFKEVDSWSEEDFVPKKSDKQTSLLALKEALEVLAGFEGRSVEDNEAVLKAVCDKHNLKVPQVFIPVRVAVTGTKASPPLFPSMQILGSEVVMSRIKKCIEFFN